MKPKRYGLRKLRHRMTPYQHTQRMKKLQRRNRQQGITEGVRRDKWRRWK